MTKYFYILIVLILSCSSIQAQNKSNTFIQGQIRTTDNKPAESVHVMLSETNYGTLTDEKGKYKFSAQKGNYTLLVFYMNEVLKEMPATIKEGANTLPDIIVDKQDFSLDEVVVTGTRTARSLKDSPVLTQVISGKAIQESGSATVLEALENFVPGVMFTPNAMGDNINVGGLENKYVLVLVDGERLVNERTENVNFTRLNTADVKQIEIINGASSVLYGSNAIGAIINIITKDVDKPTEGDVQVRYSKYNTWIGNASFGFKSGNFTSKTILSSKSSDGYNFMKDNRPLGISNDPYFDYSIGEVLKYKFNDKLDAELKGTYYRNKIWLLNNLQNRIDQNYTGGLKVNYVMAPNNALTLTGSMDKYTGDIIYTISNDPKQRANKSENTTFRLLDVWDINKNIQLVSGSEFNYETAFSYNQFGDKPADKDANNFNLFTQGELKTDTGLEALVGVRYTYHSEFGAYLSPKISLMYKLNDFRFRANISNGFKAPTVKELYMSFPHQIGGQTSFYIFGNPDLKPEESWYKAISAEYVGKKLNASITVYENRVENKIIEEPGYSDELQKETFTYKNVDEAKLTGVDLSVQWNVLLSLSIRGGYAFVHAMDETKNQRLAGSSKHNATLNAVFKKNHLPLISKKHHTSYSLTLSGRYMSPRVLKYITENNKEKEVMSDDYYMVNFVYNQQFPIHNHIKGNLQFGINNLFDYVKAGTTSANPGRTCFISLGVNF